MEAKDAPGKIRPLPPDLPEVATGPSPPPDKRWVPIVVAGGALVFFGLLAGLLGSDPAATDAGSPGRAATTTSAAGLGAAPPPPTTTTTIPPTLQALVPGLNSDLRIVSQGLDGTSTEYRVWQRNTREPNAANPTGGLAVAGAFDAARREFAWLTSGRRDTLWLGLPPVAEPAFIDVAGAAWHPSAPQTIAWVGRSQGDAQLHLFRATVQGGVRMDDVVDLGQIPEGSTLIGWGDWGFALSVPPEPSLRQFRIPNPADPGGQTILQQLGFTLLLDLDGARSATLVGIPRAAGPDGHLVVQIAAEAYSLASAAIDIDATGLGDEPIVVERDSLNRPFTVLGPDLEQTGIGFVPSSAATTFTFSPTGSHVTAAGAVDGRIALVTEKLDGTQRRITSVDGVDVLVGFTESGELLVLHGFGGGDLVFHDWNRGTTHRVPWRSGRVVAIDG